MMAVAVVEMEAVIWSGRGHRGCGSRVEMPEMEVEVEVEVWQK